jgi:hypothetical protein
VYWKAAPSPRAGRQSRQNDTGTNSHTPSYFLSRDFPVSTASAQHAAFTNPAAAIHARHAARPSTVTLRHAVVTAVPASSSITRLSLVSFPLNATAVDSRKLQTCRELAGRAAAVASVTTVQLDEDYQLWGKVPDLSKHYCLLIARCVAVMTPTPTAMAPTENKMKEFKEVG